MRPLWREPDFAKLLAGQAVSEIGSVATRTALPLAAILALDAGPLEVGILAVSASAAVLIVGLYAGAWVDRLERRPVMIAADLGRALALATIPLAAAMNALRIELLYAAAFVSASLGVFFTAAYQAYPPSLVPRTRLVEANSALSAVGSTAELTGPSLGGALVQFLTAPFAILLDAISFVVSALSLALIGAREPPPAPRHERRPIGEEMRTGVAFMAREPSLRVIALSSAVSMLFGNFFAALYALYAIDELELSPLVLGLIVSGGGVGGLAAAAVAAPLARRFGIGPTILAAEIGAGVLALLVPLAAGPLAWAFLLVPQIVGDGLATAAGINMVTLRQLVTPDRVLGRVNASMHVMRNGIAPFGALVGAAIAEVYGIRVAVWVASLGILGGALLMLLPSPLPRMGPVSSAPRG